MKKAVEIYLKINKQQTIWWTVSSILICKSYLVQKVVSILLPKYSNKNLNKALFYLLFQKASWLENDFILLRHYIKNLNTIYVCH